MGIETRSSDPDAKGGIRSEIRTERGAERQGAAPSAPTAPHAGDANAGQTPTGPSRFWDGRRAKIAFVAALVGSLLVHGVFSPYTLLPDTGGVTFKDVDDELTVPIELMAVEVAEAPKEEPKPATPEAVDPTGELGGAKPDAGPKRKPWPQRDAAVADASDTDGSSDAVSDGGVAETTDAAPDAAQVASGVKDGGAPKIGFSGLVTAGPTNVRLLLNVALIRQHPVGAKMGPLLNLSLIHI